MPPLTMTMEEAKQITFPFGKYEGELICDVYSTDETYVEWIYDRGTLTEKLRLAIELSCFTKD